MEDARERLKVRNGNEGERHREKERADERGSGADGTEKEGGTPMLLYNEKRASAGACLAFE